MKLIKCLNAQWPSETVGYILQNKPSLHKRKVFTIRATNIGVKDNQEPVVVYYLGSKK